MADSRSEIGKIQDDPKLTCVATVIFFLFSHFSWVSGQMTLPVQKSKITKYLRRGNIKKVMLYENP